MSKKYDEDKAFEAALKGKMGWKCDCSLEIVDKKSSLKEIQCTKCGKLFKSNRDKELCFSCETSRK